MDSAGAGIGRVGKLGFPVEDTSAFPPQALTDKGILKSDLELIKKGVELWGRKNTEYFIHECSLLTARAQPRYKRAKPFPELNATPSVFVFRKFFSPLTRAMNLVNRPGYSILIMQSFDRLAKRQGMSFELYGAKGPPL